MLEGREFIQWELEAEWSVEHVFYHAPMHNDPFLIGLREKGIQCYAVTDGILRKISDTSYVVPYIGVARLLQDCLSCDDMGDLVR